ncbi:rhamnogalacturonan acetylesterase [Mesobacillus foraminis]|uniref:Lysophospholipase L1-like esterase n=1 Tax=Mesobacillus foraminis TaxID=279826 RepID=A0A4R2B504_9BACI|nr:rhamnogalacturonan acetylesterase [Mesobacillus foraminis]TCN21486.1 lysophospholipase L1-like esterase [Mesobacillus foraminis]
MKKGKRIYLAGDSTVQTYETKDIPQAGWGQYIAKYFGQEVEFVNHAIGGRSSKTFVTEGRLDAVLNMLQGLDYLLIQMGHNDAAADKPERWTDAFTTYKEYLKKYINGARNRGAVPVLITPVATLHFKNGTFVNDFPDYCQAMTQVAKEERVELIDLMNSSLRFYSSLGYEKAAQLFMGSINGTDWTHFTESGANQIARLVALGVKELESGISSYVKAERSVIDY